MLELFNINNNRVKTVEYKLNPNKVEDIPEKINTTNFIYNYSKKVIMEEKTKEKETNNEITYTSYIFAFGKHFASIKGIVGESKDTTYFHYDTLGSTRVMTDKNGEKVFDQDYLPFGQNLPKSNQLKVYNEVGMEYKFTGQKEVASIGLYYYGARYYDPSAGRFITEDTYRGELNNPQSQNLYVYVMNNPLKYVDPSGHRVTLTDDPRDQTIEQTRVLNNLTYGGEEGLKRAAGTIARKNGEYNYEEYMKRRGYKSKVKSNNTQIKQTYEINFNSYMRSSIYKQTPEYVNDLYAEANRNNINDLEELESNEALKELVKLAKYKNLFMSEMLDYGGGKIAKNYEDIFKTNYFLSQDELWSSITKNVDIIKLSSNLGSVVAGAEYLANSNDIFNDPDLTFSQKMLKFSLETQISSGEFAGGLLADYAGGIAGTYTGSPVVGVSTAIALNVFVSNYADDRRHSIYESLNLE
mgnify:CR=1 FL=1